MTISPFLFAVFLLAIVILASGQNRPLRRLGEGSKKNSKSGSFAASSKSSKKSPESSSTVTENIVKVPTARQLVASGVVCESRGTCLVEGSRCTRGFESCFDRTFDPFICDCVDIDGNGKLEYSCRFTDACRFRQHSLPLAKASKWSKKSSKSSKKSSGSSKAAKGSTKAFKSNKGYESDIVLITNAPKNGPTKAPTHDSSNAPTNPPASESTKGTIPVFVSVQCTGNPCPAETWCRSRSGTCGPGIMHCNSYSSWKQSCPTAPTMTPTPKPTTEPTGNPFSFEPTAFPNTMELPTPPRPESPTTTEPRGNPSSSEPTAFPSTMKLPTSPRPDSPTTTEPTVTDVLPANLIASVDMEELVLAREGSSEESFETSDSGLKEEDESVSGREGSSEESFETSDSGPKEEDERPKTRDTLDDKKTPLGLALGLGLGLGALFGGLTWAYHRRSLLTEDSQSLNEM